MKSGLFMIVMSLPVLAGARGTPQSLQAAPADGSLWGVRASSAATSLGWQRKDLKGPPSTDPIGPALRELFFTDDESLETLRRLVAGKKTWGLALGGRLFGYIWKDDIGRWNAYEKAARYRFGPPARDHFRITTKTGASSFVHVYSWRDETTRFVFMKFTERDDSAVWVERRLNSIMKVTVMQADDEEVPFYLGAFDLKASDSLAIEEW